MTLTTAANRVQYSGDGSTVSFPITFVFWDADDPLAVLTDSNGVETTWTRGTQYTISGGGRPGATGTLTVITSPTDYTPQGGGTPELLTIKSNLANTQPTAIPSGGSFSTVALEQQLDQMVRQLQQFAEALGRTISLPISSAESDVTIDNLTGNAALFARVNTAEDGFEYASVTSAGQLTDPVPVANGGTAGTTAAAARTNLGAVAIDAANTFTKTQSFTKGGDLTSASPLVIGTDGNYFDVAGSTGFSAMTVTAGTLFMLQFDAALTMTDGASLDLAGTNITTATGDRGLFFATAINTVQLIAWKAEGEPADIFATQAQQETGTAVNIAVSPGRQHFHPKHPKAWVKFDGDGGSGTIDADEGVSGVADNGAGDYTITWDTAFSSADYGVNVTVEATATSLTGHGSVEFGGQVAASVTLRTMQVADTRVDVAKAHVTAYGDL